jgi:hypothetical protein
MTDHGIRSPAQIGLRVGAIYYITPILVHEHLAVHCQLYCSLLDYYALFLLDGSAGDGDQACNQM